MSAALKGEFFLALAGGGGFSHEDGWCFAPPIFSFSCQKKKRKRAVHGPKEKKKYGGYDTGARRMTGGSQE